MSRPSDAEPSDRGPQDGGDAAPSTLLDAPLAGSRLHRVFVYGGPLGLAIALLVGLWVARLHVRHSVIVQMEETWVPGRSVAVRSQLLDRDLHGIEGVKVDLRLEREDGDEVPLGRLAPVPRSGTAQGRFVVPQVPLGPATVVLRYTAPSIVSFEEKVPVVVAAERKPRTPRHTVSASTLQWADDTQRQPASVRISLRPEGRVVAGFVNRFVLRITDPDGRPLSLPVEVRLVDGEFGGRRGDPRALPKVAAGTADDLGLFFFDGALASEVVRFEVRVLDVEGFAETTRRLRLVSFAGAVDLRVTPRGGGAADPVTVRALALRARRPVFVDVFDQDGAWIDTLPPFGPRTLEQSWTHPAACPGVVQFEGYHFTNRPGESTAVARVQLVEEDPRSAESLMPLFQRYRDRLDLPRVERDFDPSLELRYLDAIEPMLTTPDRVEAARRFLLGTLPVEVYGPPTALVTRPREEAALAARKHAWRIGLRVYLLGGGGLFLLSMAVSLYRAHRRLVRETDAEAVSDPAEDAELAEHIAASRRALLLRGLGVLAVMAAALVLTLAMLESLL